MARAVLSRRKERVVLLLSPQFGARVSEREREVIWVGRKRDWEWKERKKELLLLQTASLEKGISTHGEKTKEGMQTKANAVCVKT